jgi:hypothetical protein
MLAAHDTLSTSESLASERRTSATLRWRCHLCETTFTAWAPAEAHFNVDDGGGRIEQVL